MISVAIELDTMNKKIILLLVFATICVCAKAQYASLDRDEFAKLKKLIKNDVSAKVAYKNLKDTAKATLAEQPNPVEKIMSEGLLAGNPDKVRSLKAVEDADKIYALAVTYKVENEKKYLSKASEFLQAWAKMNKSSGDPIDETKLETLYSAYDLLRGDVSADVRKSVDSWLSSIAETELNVKWIVGTKGKAINNWNSHRIKIITMIAYALHDSKYTKIIEHELERQIAVNLYPDGSGYDFEERDALHYHIYTLEPLLTAITVVYRATGKDYFNYESNTGSSIKKSVDFLVPFVTGEKPHGEFLNSKAAFDKARAKNGEAGYIAGAKFNTETGVYALEEAAYFNAKYTTAAMAGSTNDHSADWQLILNKVRKPFTAK